MTRIVSIGIMLVGLSCAGGTGRPGVDVDLGGSGADRVLRFYLGSYMTSAEVDSVLVVDGSSIRLDLERLEASAPDFHAALGASAADGTIDRDELQAAVQASYAGARSLPPTAAGLAALTGHSAESPDWMVLRVRGSMTPYERRLFVPVDAVRSAIESYIGTRGELVYPVGTVIVGEHLQDGRVVETTAMLRREDGFWDFVAYDASGTRTDQIRGEPDPLAVPTQCFGCHYGNRLFEPEKSFPVRPPDGPHGPRSIDVPDAWVDPGIVSLFDEHRRRDDGLLGLYATLLVGRWRAAAGTGDLPPGATRILEALGL